MMQGHMIFKDAQMEKPAVPFRQGGREAYSMVMTLRELDDWLPDREGEQDLDKFTTVNRPLLMKHALNILDFMKLNEDWILGNFTISAKPDEIQWDQPKNVLTVENKALFIIDGQHRRRAISQLLHELRADLNRANDLEKTEAQQVLVTLYVCQHERDMKQLFAWMAKSKPIESNTQELFDSSDPWNKAAQDIRDDTDLLKDRVNLNKSTLGRTDEYLLTNSLLRNNALVMTLGGKNRATKNLTQHHRQDGPQAEITLNSKSFYDNFLPECHDIFARIKAGDVANVELPHLRQNHWLLEPLILRLMADCYGQVKRTNADQEALMEHIHSMNMDREKRPEERYRRAERYRPGEETALPSEQGRLDTGCQPDHQGRDRLNEKIGNQHQHVENQRRIEPGGFKHKENLEQP